LPKYFMSPADEPLWITGNGRPGPPVDRTLKRMPLWHVLIPLALLLGTGGTVASVVRTAPAQPGLELPRPELPRDGAILRYPRLAPVSLSADATPLLVSNSPETPTSPGLLYRDRVQGAARVTAYHVNGLEQPARLLIVAEAADTAAPNLTVHLTLLRRGSAVTSGPDPLIGQQTLLRYFASGPESAGGTGAATVPPATGSPATESPGGLTRTLPSGQRLTLYDSGLLSPGQVVSVLLDFFTDSSLTVSTYMLRAGESPGPDVPILAPDGLHQRGTFTGANRNWKVSVPPDSQTISGPSPGPWRLMFSDATDLAVTGTDALTGQPQTLEGNFGVLYSISLQGGAGFLMAASARGGPYRGSLFMQDTTSSGQVRLGPLLIGRGRALLEAAQPAAVWQIRSDATHFEFVPANGSNLPLALVFYPDGIRRPLR
jgi:hypothetical protein